MERVKRAGEKTVNAISETVDLGDMITKLDEIVKWINEHEKGADIDYERTARQDVYEHERGGDPTPK